MQNGMGWIGIGQSFEWTIINTSITTGYIIIGSNTGHAYIGNNTLTTNASYRFLTLLEAQNQAITYRIAN